MGPIADAFARLGDWLRARPHRLTVVNALLLTGILVMLGNGDLFRFVGGAAVALCAGVFAIRSVRQMERQRGAGIRPDALPSSPPGKPIAHETGVCGRLACV
ncbi:hypothetical protein V5F34_16695 [Xanthobacter autotrophicus]|uniref:hypothetical protein n=1 Tax=Xanthobacter autotrophicus TaxID=280 RepID=UPI00372C110D